MGAHLARDRKWVAFDRLLSRLVAVAADRWLLKGGFALDLRLTERARATKDTDLDWRDRDDELLDTLLAAADHDVGDFFTFRIERAGPPEDQLGGSCRVRVSAPLPCSAQSSRSAEVLACQPIPVSADGYLVPHAAPSLA